MPGFVCIISDQELNTDNLDIKIPTLAGILNEKRSFVKGWVKWYAVSKFMDDKVFAEDVDRFICMDGVILNSRQLRNEYAAKDSFDLYARMFAKCGAGFVREFRGDFVGIVHDKRGDAWHAFTNHIGSKPIFYFFDEVKRTLIVGTELKMVVAGMRQMGYSPEIDAAGASCLLAMGWMLEDYTLIKTVKRLPAGAILTYKEGKIEIERYYRLATSPIIEDDEEQILAELDFRFGEAVRAEYEKDIEYGFRHIATLSGGMDSRISLHYARKLGYRDILCIAFSQNDAPDERISRRLASDWKCEYLFLSLDNGTYLQDIDSPVIANDGLILYSGSAHALRIERLINWQEFGLFHHGQLGEILGDYKETKDTPVVKGAQFLDIRKSFFTILDPVRERYDSDYLFTFYNRGINGMLNGAITVSNFTDAVSPFSYLEFVEYVSRIPESLCRHRRLYKNWMRRYAGEAANYPWERTGLPVTAGEYQDVLFIYLRAIKRRLLGSRSKVSTNPFEYWYRTNPELRNALQDYYIKGLPLLDCHPDIKRDVQLLFETGNVENKTQALTLLAAVKVHQLVG